MVWNLRSSTLAWLLMLGLTIATYLLGLVGLAGDGLILTLMLIALAKGQLLVDHFMGLRQCSGVWRPLLNGYLFVLGGALLSALLL